MNAKERFSSPPAVFFLYLCASLLAVFTWRCFVLSGGGEPLKRFFFTWCAVTALVDFIRLYPALAFSALVIPFGLKEHPGNGYAGGTFVGNKGFSPRFLQYITWPVITAAAAAVLYGGLFFAVLPIASGAKLSMESRGALYRSSLEKAKSRAAARDWAAAARLLSLCDGIWPNSAEVNEFKMIYQSDFSSYYSGEKAAGRPEEEESGGGEPLSAAEAMARAEKAFAEENWYDAHWLATLAARLAGTGSAAQAPAQALASRAWNKIAEIEPNAGERERFANYRLKQDGYLAMQARDWINAYYIFRELALRTPNDPDIEHFLAGTERGLSSAAFFLDEIDMAVGGALQNPVFSLPVDEKPETGRMTLRFSSLILQPDYSYAWNPELAAVDENGVFLYRVRSEYGKVVPEAIQSAAGRREQAVLLLRALDRTDSEKRLEPVWIGEAGEETAFGGAQILLNLGYDDFVLLSRIKQGTEGLNLGELFAAEKKLGAYGYAPEIFRAELARRLAEPLFFLPLAVLILCLGWRHRARRKPRYVYLPMLAALPAVFYGVTLFYRSILNNFSIWLSFSFGLSTILALLAGGAALCFILALIFLAAQHG